MGYVRLADNEDFSGKYDTYIIAYCPDIEAWFISKKRHFYYEFPKEFNTRAEAIAFFERNLDFFFDCGVSMYPCCGIPKRDHLHLLDVDLVWERINRYGTDLFNDVVQYCLDEGTGIEYEEGMNFTTKKEVREHGSKRLRYVSWEAIQWFLAKKNIEYTKYIIQKRKTGDIEGTRLLAYDEWRMMCEFFKCPKLTFEDAMEISKTLYKYDVEILDIIMGEDDD